MNIKSLLAKPEQYTDYQPRTPAEKAAAVWDEREGGLVMQNMNLRKITIGLIVLSILLAAALVYKSLASNVIPYVVEVDINTGEVRGVGTVQSMTTYEPSENVYRYFLTRFLRNAREVPLDPVVYKSHLTDCFGFLTVDAARKFQTQLTDEKIGDKIGKYTVQVNIVSVLPIQEGGRSYQIRWEETEYAVATGQKTVTSYSGILTMQTITVADEEQLKINPVGLYISDFNWSKDTTK